MGKKKLVGNINNVISYIILYNSTKILCKGLLDSNIIKKVGFIDEMAKNHAYRYF